MNKKAQDPTANRRYREKVRDTLLGAAQMDNLAGPAVIVHRGSSWVYTFYQSLYL